MMKVVHIMDHSRSHPIVCCTSQLELIHVTVTVYMKMGTYWW